MVTTVSEDKVVPTFIVSDAPPKTSRVYDWVAYRDAAVAQPGKWIGMDHKSAHVTASQIRSGKRYSAYDWSDYEVASDMTHLWIRYAPLGG